MQHVIRMRYMISFLRDSRPSSARSPPRVDRGYISRLGKRVAVDDMHDKRVVVDNVLNKRAGVETVHDKRAGVDDMNRENREHFMNQVCESAHTVCCYVC